MLDCALTHDTDLNANRIVTFFFMNIFPMLTYIRHRARRVVVNVDVYTACERERVKTNIEIPT